MDTQNKEFDRVFHSKLGDFEAEPSPMVWDNIANGLQQKKRRAIPYLSIAASIILLISAGLLFFRKAENNVVKPTKSSRTIVRVSKPAADNLANNNVDAMPEKVNTVTNEVTSQKKYIVFKAPKVVVDKEPSQKSIKDNGSALIDPAPIDPGPMPVVAESLQNIPNMQVPDKETPFVVAANNNTREVIEKTVITEDIENAPAKKRGIHSLGGLLGAIVAKIDKREDKLIEFTETEENRSTVTGINLGLIKIKKK